MFVQSIQDINYVMSSSPHPWCVIRIKMTSKYYLHKAIDDVKKNLVVNYHLKFQGWISKWKIFLQCNRSLSYLPILYVLKWSSHIFWRCLVHQSWTIHNNETAKCNLLSDSATPTKWIEWDLVRKLPLSFVVVVLLLVIVLMVITKIVLGASWRRRTE